MNWENDATKFFTMLANKELHKHPTKKHRPAVWECMLGTLYALGVNGEVKYFDYDYGAALKFAGITSDDGIRVSKARNNIGLQHDLYGPSIGKGQVVIWKIAEECYVDKTRCVKYW